MADSVVDGGGGEEDESACFFIALDSLGFDDTGLKLKSLISGHTE